MSAPAIAVHSLCISRSLAVSGVSSATLVSQHIIDRDIFAVLLDQRL